MLDIKRNERLAIQMGWELISNPTQVPYSFFWRAPDGKLFDELPDFCGDDCAAVKWLLPSLRKHDPHMWLEFYPDKARVLFRDDEHLQSVYAMTLSLALAAAVDAMEEK